MEVKENKAILGGINQLDRFFNVLFDSILETRFSGAVRQTSYRAVQRATRALLEIRNDFDVIGEELIPTQGGVVFASNHQSWLDIFALIAASPRRVHFMAKSEFKDWPIVRQGIRLSESLYLNRKGGEKTLAETCERLREGWAVAIYPEGAIPGEEDLPRRIRDPRTGMLPGKTGAVRLAMRAEVPIVPVGVSGTERVLPPEMWPRMGIFRRPPTAPITVQFGKSIRYDEYDYESVDRVTLRELTDQLMDRISVLVDHRANYVPIQVPPTEKIQPVDVGVLLLHGFTSHPDSVRGIVPRLEQAGIPWSAPVLRGHGSRYQELNGVTAKDWYVDAERALIDLWDRVDKVVIVGYSMGGLVALELAMRHPGKIAGVVTASACLKFSDPLARFSKRFASAIKYWSSPESIRGPAATLIKRGYPRFPVATFASLYDYSREILGRLGEMHVPILVLHSKRDTVVPPLAAHLLYERVSSSRREIVWFKKSGHSLLVDRDAPEVFDEIMAFVQSLGGPQTARRHSKRPKGPIKASPRPRTQPRARTAARSETSGGPERQPHESVAAAGSDPKRRESMP